MGASLYSRIVLIVVCALSVAGCSSSSDESYSSESKTIEDINWIKTCEADYNSSDCDEAILKMIQKQEDVSLYAKHNIVNIDTNKIFDYARQKWNTIR